MTRQFSSFIKAKKADGTDSENYEKVLNWLKTAVPLTKDKENATMVKLVGSLSANDYVGSDEQLHEGTIASMQFFNDFDEFACDLDIEGYIKSITDEERGPEDDKKPTGRKRLNLISMDFYHNALDIKNIIIPKDFVDALEDNGYVKGATAKMYVSWKPNEKGEAKPKTKGFGQQRVTEGKSYLEMVLTGGDIAYDEDEQEDMIITPQMCKAMLNERASRLKELEEAGYQGSKGGSSSSAPTGFGKKGSGKMSPVVDDDDDIPF
jgi:hypothetical protein|uniref:Uncharacterized protein n=1 Tax=Bacteriophage sp. TaxID=38018 RepID=A0A8D9PEG4_9VIRU|nr:MAG TPA: hypothetical protein [Bacteriophage sp.]